MQLAVIVTLILYVCRIQVCGVPFRIALGLSVGARAPSARRAPSESSPVVQYDEFGRIQQLDFAQCMIDSARSVIALRLRNGTLVGFVDNQPTRSVLQVSQSHSPLSIVSSTQSSVSTLMTGHVADANFVVMKAREAALNHIHLYDSPVHGKRISSVVADIIMDNYMRGDRPLATHAFVIANHSIWEVDCRGVVQEISAGAAGLDRDSAIQILEQSFNTNMNIEEAKDLIHRIYRNQLESSSKGKLLRMMWLED